MTHLRQNITESRRRHPKDLFGNSFERIHDVSARIPAAPWSVVIRQEGISKSRKRRSETRLAQLSERDFNLTLNDRRKDPMQLTIVSKIPGDMVTRKDLIHAL